MANPFIAEIRMFGGNFAPSGWATCDGQILPITQNTALFSIVGTNFGGNGTTNFGLPNFQGSAPLGQGNGAGLSPRNIGEAGGVPTVTLLLGQMAVHSHSISCFNSAGSSLTPGGNIWSDSGLGRGDQVYTNAIGTGPTMNNGVIGMSGGNVPHNNMPPFLTVTFIIALRGTYPARN
jgi:microcystin-dependent protein